MTDAIACPCGHGPSYAGCCEPLHRGDRRADTAEALMRSRYAAFARGEVAYLIATWHPSQRAGLQREELAASCRALRWLGLRILDRVAGQPGDATGVVEFEASYEGPDGRGVLHERSRFVREDGAWFYLDGSGSDRPARAAKVGRNDPCPCGSGQKFKRCCGGPFKH